MRNTTLLGALLGTVLAGAPTMMPATAGAQEAPGAGQEDGLLARQRAANQRRAEVLRGRGRIEDATQIRALMPPGLLAGVPESRAAHRDAHLDRLAQDLAAAGFTAGRINAARAQGIDILAAAAAGGDATLEQRAALSELVVVGEVVGVQGDEAPGDGFRSSTRVRVREVLKGPQRTGEVVVRQLSGESASGERVEVSSDLRAEPGQVYLFFLSRGLYELAAGTQGRGAAGDPAFYVIQRAPYRVEGDRLVPSHYAREREPRGAAATFEQIRAVGRKVQ